jgi:hypothetical protein
VQRLLALIDSKPLIFISFENLRSGQNANRQRDQLMCICGPTYR